MQKKVWLTSSVLAGAAALAALVIPLAASANITHAATKVHCRAHSNQVVNISQFANDAFSAQAQSKTCTVSMTGSYTSGAPVAPVMVKNKKLTVDAAGVFTAPIKNKIFTGAITGQLVNPKGASPGTHKCVIKVSVALNPVSVRIDVTW